VFRSTLLQKYQGYCFQTSNTFLLLWGYCTWQLEFDLDLWMTLAVKVKVFNFAKIAITSLFMIRFVSYFDKTTRSYLTYHNRLHKTTPPHPTPEPPPPKKKCFHFFSHFWNMVTKIYFHYFIFERLSNHPTQESPTKVFLLFYFWKIM